MLHEPDLAHMGLAQCLMAMVKGLRHSLPHDTSWRRSGGLLLWIKYKRTQKSGFRFKIRAVHFQPSSKKCSGLIMSVSEEDRSTEEIISMLATLLATFESVGGQGFKLLFAKRCPKQRQRLREIPKFSEN